MTGEKILVVDDSRSIREAFTLAFEDYGIITADSGAAALEILRKLNDIDVVVLDVMMPDTNGLVLLEEIRKINKHAKFVIMTGYSSKDIAVEALRLRADEYIEKPFDIETVRQVLERLLKWNPEAGEAQATDTQKKITLAQRLISRNYHRDLSLQHIAKELFMSYKYLSRLIKERTGSSFNEQRVKLRISAAKEMLRERAYTVSQIAYKIGYHNPDSFMKIFKKATGQTPSQYRSLSRREAKGRRRAASNTYKEG